MKKTWQECFAATWRHYSTYLVLVLHAALVYFLYELGPAQQAAIISFIPGLAPFGSFIVFVLLKAIPQVWPKKPDTPADT